MQKNRYSLRKMREGAFTGTWVLRKNGSLIGRFASGYVGIQGLRYEMKCDERDARRHADDAAEEIAEAVA